ncbi:MAG: exodeoxyribonuclease VII large subunit [Spirochaetales bacterium]|nr:exodeoxyribonuclease VII large subunit [Spirochaetales bacterium]
MPILSSTEMPFWTSGMDEPCQNRYADAMPTPLVLTVSQLTAGIKELLETGFTDLIIEGEVSGLASTSGKNLYFSLKDENALLTVVWFSSASRPGATPPADGDRVRVWGRISVYEPQGQYQLVVSRVEALGIGDILARLERLKKKLESEGLFDPQKRRSIPPYPRVIGLVTSSSGAALQDMLRIFLQHNVPATVRIFPVPVQGQEAPTKIVQMLNYVSTRKLADVLILGRGGGSLEDLLAFSDESVVRAVASCEIPVISAVGHETDSPLTAWAADQRTPTPTAAAELLARPWAVLLQTLHQLRNEMLSSLHWRLDRAQAALRDFRPERLEETFRRLVQPRYQRLDDAKETLVHRWKERLFQLRSRLEIAGATLSALSPWSVLDRGWALVSTESGSLVTSSQGLAPGDSLWVKWKDSQVRVEVKEIHR